MKSGIAVLTAGLLVCAAAYCSFYFLSARRDGTMHGETPELAWLQREFRLTDDELMRIAGLHAAYQPHCDAMCRRIHDQNSKLRELLGGSRTMTPEIEAVVAQAAELRGLCQRDMLRHFFEVSQTMPPEQGRRYLEWISERTLFPAQGIDAHGQR